MSKEIEKSNQKDIEKNYLSAALSYFWIFSVFIYYTKKKSKFSQFHAKQGLVLFILSLATIVPFFGQLLLLVLIFVSVWGFFKAYSGEWFKIPFVYELSKKINF